MAKVVIEIEGEGEDSFSLSVQVKDCDINAGEEPPFGVKVGLFYANMIKEHAQGKAKETVEVTEGSDSDIGSRLNEDLAKHLNL